MLYAGKRSIRGCKSVGQVSTSLGFKVGVSGCYEPGTGPAYA